MNHCIFVGDTVILSADIECGEYLPRNQRPNGYGIDVLAHADTEVDFVRHNGEHFVFTWSNAFDYNLYDVEILALPTEFDHDHNLCEEVFTEHQPTAYEWSTA